MQHIGKRFTTEVWRHGGFDQDLTDRSDLFDLSDPSSDGSYPSSLILLSCDTVVAQNPLNPRIKFFLRRYQRGLFRGLPPRGFLLQIIFFRDFRFPWLKLSGESPRRGNRKLLRLPTPKRSAQPPSTHSAKTLLALINIFDMFIPLTRFSFRMCQTMNHRPTMDKVHQTSIMHNSPLHCIRLILSS